MANPQRPDLGAHLDPEQKAKLEAAEAASRVAGSSERADEIAMAAQSQEAAAKRAGENGGAVPPAATPGIENVQTDHPLEQIMLVELEELKRRMDKVAVYEIAAVMLMGVCAAALLVRFYQNIEPPDLSKG